MSVGTCPREEQSRGFLEEHRIPELFNNLTSQLIFHRPDDPRDFMIQTLESLKQARTTGIDHPCLFDDSNIESVFGMLDPNTTGYIRLAQYKAGLITLGINKFNEHPPGSEMDRISLAAFKKEA
ncbi:DgyrCDS2808 [Dimorphilus gyrociliatus]|uniref:DgyrCDS2808 n=1 Tax=Dimorphilus gyrociliatus TaxID=2664684 RepID=A0A7I8VBY8_9ANNE|nr:DgyrCDS2808 [Dimorphilus gyrociliatus]